MKIGIVGLGAIGSAFAARLLARGEQVAGFDPAPAPMQELQELGGLPMRNSAELAANCAQLILALPNGDALGETAAAIASVKAPEGAVVIDVNTLSPAVKANAQNMLAASGWAMLDCAVSGNHAMVRGGEYAFYASGAPQDLALAKPLLQLLSNDVIETGEFGSASKVKIILNHLVMIHTAAAAEAMAFATQAGLDGGFIYEMVRRSAASSRLFDMRGKMMVEGDYTSSRGNYHVIMKDAGVIGEFAGEVGYATPLFNAASAIHALGVQLGYAEQDTASLYAVLQSLHAAQAKAQP